MNRKLYNDCKNRGISVLHVKSMLSVAGFEVPQRTLQYWFDQDFSNCKNPEVLSAINIIIKSHDSTISKLTKVFEK